MKGQGERERQVELKTEELKGLTIYEHTGKRKLKHHAKVPSFRNLGHYYGINKKSEVRFRKGL